MAAASLSLTIAMPHTTDGLSQSEPSYTKTRTPSANNGRRNIQVIGFAADEVIDVTDVTTPRECYFRNLDSTNYVDIGPNNGGTMLGLTRLGPGDHCAWPLLPGVVMRAQANTAAVQLYCNIRPT